MNTPDNTQPGYTEMVRMIRAYLNAPLPMDGFHLTDAEAAAYLKGQLTPILSAYRNNYYDERSRRVKLQEAYAELEQSNAILRGADRDNVALVARIAELEQQLADEQLETLRRNAARDAQLIESLGDRAEKAEAELAAARSL
jgi:hypothetical protein